MRGKQGNICHVMSNHFHHHCVLPFQWAKCHVFVWYSTKSTGGKSPLCSLCFRTSVNLWMTVLAGWLLLLFGQKPSISSSHTNSLNNLFILASYPNCVAFTSAYGSDLFIMFLAIPMNKYPTKLEDPFCCFFIYMYYMYGLTILLKALLDGFSVTIGVICYVLPF